MPILSEVTFLKSGKLFKRNFQSRSLNTCAASSTQCPNFRGLFTSKVTWHYVKSEAQKMNLSNCRNWDLREARKKVLHRRDSNPCLSDTSWVLLSTELCLQTLETNDLLVTTLMIIILMKLLWVRFMTLAELLLKGNEIAKLKFQQTVHIEQDELDLYFEVKSNKI